MRLWHRDLLRYLPASQLLSQKRECDLIWKDLAQGKQTNHILINYIWSYQEYELELFDYYSLLADEFERRGFKFNYSKHIVKDYHRFGNTPFEEHHNQQYLIQCFCNLQEKYVRGQKDFDLWTYRALTDFVRKEVNKYVK